VLQSCWSDISVLPNLDTSIGDRHTVRVWAQVSFPKQVSGLPAIATLWGPRLYQLDQTVGPVRITRSRVLSDGCPLES
jgi:hypothetical protein